MGLETGQHQTAADTASTTERDSVNEHAAGDRNGRLLPEMTEQVPSQYIPKLGNTSASLELSNIFEREDKSKKPGEQASQPRTQAQISEACWADFEQSHKPNDFKIDANQRHQVIDNLLRELQERYVNPNLVETAAKTLRSREQEEYAGIDSAKQFTEALNKDLQSVFKDKHLNVFFDDKTLLTDFSKSSPEVMDMQLKQQICERSGVEAVQTLEGNIGYLQLTGFFPSNSEADPRAAELTKREIDSAMAKLADKDALIIDLRDNTGGDPHTVLRTLNHLLEPGTNVNNIHWREGKNTRIESMTTQSPDGPKFGSQKPIYLLTSDRTFSAGEEFAYDLQSLGRAKIVGGVTGGGANPTYAFRLTDNFGVAIPTAQSINPVTGKNWEGTGVKPDIEVAPEQALELALQTLSREFRRR